MNADRLFMGAVALGYLKYSRQQTRVYLKGIKLIVAHFIKSVGPTRLPAAVWARRAKAVLRAAPKAGAMAVHEWGASPAWVQTGSNLTR
jgi:hypothetical protein